jgi:hypothetical protein
MGAEFFLIYISYLLIYYKLEVCSWLAFYLKEHLSFEVPYAIVLLLISNSFCLSANNLTADVIDNADPSINIFS